jgi:hypothetical protein
MIDIDSMTSSQWLNYRDDLLEDFYRRGFVLKPNIHCKQCDIDDEYTCFECEVQQIEDKK